MFIPAIHGGSIDEDNNGRLYLTPLWQAGVVPARVVALVRWGVVRSFEIYVEGTSGKAGDITILGGGIHAL